MKRTCSVIPLILVALMLAGCDLPDKVLMSGDTLKTLEQKVCQKNGGIKEVSFFAMKNTEADIVSSAKCNDGAIFYRPLDK